jgi:hypothetical protein
MKRRLDDLSPESRLEVFRKDARLLDRLTRVVHKKALAADDNTAWGHLALKCLERRASMHGTDAPSRVDMAVVAQTERGTSTDALYDALNSLAGEDGVSEESRAMIRATGGYLPEPELQPEPDPELEPSADR